MERINLITSATVIDPSKWLCGVLLLQLKTNERKNKTILLLGGCVNPIALENERSPEKKTNTP